MIKGHTGGVRRVAFSQDSCSLLSASDDKTIKVSGTLFQHLFLVINYDATGLERLGAKVPTNFERPQQLGAIGIIQ